MRALTVKPGSAGTARLDDLPEPEPDRGAILAEGLAIGICGTDLEIVRGDYGWPPEGRDRLILGHESLGRVIEAPPGDGFAPGDLIVGIVRRPDPVPCPCCARGEWDMCRNGRYTERGIKSLDGYGSERWRVEPEFAVHVDPRLERVGMLLEPTSIVAKAWEQIERIGSRACFPARRALITGAGPIGLLAAMLAVQRGFEVEVLDRVDHGHKPELVAGLGATYRTDGVTAACSDADVVVECTGVPELVLEVAQSTRADAIVCLTGVSPAGRTMQVDVGGLSRELVLQNDVIFGSVNANRRHYEAAAEALHTADPDWLGRLITRRVPMAKFEEALERREDDVKVVLELAA